MEEKQLYVRTDRPAEWPEGLEMSPEERNEHERIFRIVEADSIRRPSPLVVLVLDEGLPADIVASVVEDPGNPAHPMLVFSRRSYSFAAQVMAENVRGSKKTNAIFRQLGRLDVTSAGAIVDRDGSTVVQLKPPPQLMWDMRDLARVTTDATSSKSVEVPDVGRGQLYRFPPSIR